MKLKKGLFFVGPLLLAFTVGAATGTKITAELQSKTINCNGNISSQQAITYKGTTYLPLRSLASLMNTSVDYKNGVIYIGESGSVTAPAQKEKFKFTINSVSTAYNYENKEVAIVDITFVNNSGETTSPLASLYSVRAFQNGVELESNHDSDLTEYDNFTSVLSGSTLNYQQLFIIKDKSPITIEVSEFLGDKKVSKKFNLN